MGKKSNSLGRKCRKWIVYGKKNFLEILNVFLIGYLLFSLWLVIGKYPFTEKNLLLLPLYFHLWMFYDGILKISALTIVAVMCIGLKKRNPLSYFVIRAILFAQAFSSVWLIASLGKILFLVEGIIAGVLFYFMESKRIKAKFKVAKMNWGKLYGYMFIILALIHYFQLQFQPVGGLVSSDTNVHVTYQRRGESVISSDGKILARYTDNADERKITLCETGTMLANEVLIKTISIPKKLNIHWMALSADNKLLAISCNKKNKADAGFQLYDVEGERWVDGFVLKDEEDRERLKLGNGIYKLEFNSTNEYLALVRTLGVEFWDIKNRSLVKRVSETLWDKVYWLENTQYLRLTNRKIYLGDLFGTEETVIEADSFIEVRVSPDKKYIAVITNKENPSFYVWDIKQRKIILKKDFYEIRPKESNLFSLEEIQSKLLAEQETVKRRIDDIGFSQDNRKLVVFSNEEKKYMFSLIDVESGQVKKIIIRKEKCPVRDTKFIENNKIVTYGMQVSSMRQDGSVITYRLNQD